jgi:hypothetical protein
MYDAAEHTITSHNLEKEKGKEKGKKKRNLDGEGVKSQKSKKRASINIFVSIVFLSCVAIYHAMRHEPFTSNLSCIVIIHAMKASEINSL